MHIRQTGRPSFWSIKVMPIALKYQQDIFSDDDTLTRVCILKCRIESSLRESRVGIHSDKYIRHFTDLLYLKIYFVFVAFYCNRSNMCIDKLG